MNIAKKVAFDMGVRVGSTVGYSIQNESMIGQDTKIRFVTTGILLNQVINGKDLSD
jgi:pre-mRNA-splicing factor ATP-dependent RNA helicase DHX38/PRP16